VVKISTGFDVIPVDLNDKSDKDLIEALNKILKRFLKTSTSTHKDMKAEELMKLEEELNKA